MAKTLYNSFWQFIKSQPIEIPIIQRDYAQGRSGMERLREKFLKDIKAALENPTKKLKLDFVYGSIEDAKLQPLDGQQRLTTLWLLHWYIAFKAGKLEENKEIFKQFTYETRASSKEFCKKLSEFIEPTDDEIVLHIQNKTWFYSAWKQDPTIQAMLNMLGGTDVKDKNIDIIDGIEELFNDNFETYWDCLTGDNCPIIFYYMPLSELKLSDDLYIKMNARGKPLSSFENFKADLVGFLKTQIENSENDENWQSFDINTFESKLDTDWTDVFWKSRSNDSKIDEIYFAFLNRYFLNTLIVAKNLKSNNLPPSQKEIEENKSFKYLMGDKSDVYADFGIYEQLLIDENIIGNVSIILKNFSVAIDMWSEKDSINMLFYPNWGNDLNFRFIPEYIENPKWKENKSLLKYIPTPLTQPQRVVFHAICCYFENGEFKEESLKQWMRVVWNIVENANVTNNESMIGAMRLIDDMAIHSHGIYAHLKDRDISKDFANEQMQEEKDKATQILQEAEWERKIIEAEKHAFFKGAIRFLYRTGDGIVDWGKFDDRFEKSKKYFDANGVKNEYKKDAILLRKLISCFNNWAQFWDIKYDNKNSTWKNILTNEKWLLPISRLFDEEINTLDSFETIEEFNDVQKSVHKDLVRTCLLANIVDDCKLHWRDVYQKYALYPYNTRSQSKIFVLGDERNQIIFNLEGAGTIEVNNSQNIENLPFYKGWEIYFTLKKSRKEYCWWMDLREKREDGNWYKVENIGLEDLTDIFKNEN